MAQCICTKVCDCQNPPPDDWDGKNGVYHISQECPIHNMFPNPHPDCSVHTERPSLVTQFIGLLTLDYQQHGS